MNLRPDIFYRKYYKKINITLLAIFGSVTVFLAICGGVINYSPIPQWDMWNGTLDFYIRAQSGDLSAWWYQHNEHRIFLARLLFYIDNYFFGGKNIFLIVVNYLLVSISAVFLWFFLTENSPKKFTYENLFSFLIILPWLFFWSQENNLTWGFQVQFFLAILLPLIALYFFAKSINNEKFYYISIFVGILSIGSMANGLLVLPILTLYSYIIYRVGNRTILLLILSAISFCLYFLNYKQPALHGNLFHQLSSNTFEYIWFTALYLGSAFGGIYNFDKVRLIISTMSGLFVLIIFPILLIRNIKQVDKKNSYPLALLLFVLYIVLTAFITAGGRLVFGLDQALSSRYTTSSVMLIAALFVLYRIKYKNYIGGLLKKIFIFIFIVSSLFFINFQLNTLKPSRDILSVREIAALSLAIGLRDDDYIGNIYPNPNEAIDISNLAIKNDYSIFGSYPYKDLKNLLGVVELGKLQKKCQGGIDKVELILDSDKFVRLHGWIGDGVDDHYPLLVKISDSSGRIVGFSLTGTRRPDLVEKRGGEYKFAGFRGYLLTGATGRQLYASVDDKCSFGFYIDPIIINTKKIDYSGPIKKEDFLATKDIASSNGWGGSDFNNSKITNFKVLGTYATSDADTGVIVIHGRKKIEFLYRSGPVVGNQRLKILNSNLSYVLPASPEWRRIQIDGAEIPDKFDFSISDLGKSWGEWSAIGLWDE